MVGTETYHTRIGAMPDRGRILIVDDERAVLDVFKDSLELDGHSVVTAQSGEEALAILEEKEFDVVLTDLKMEKVSGLDVLRRTKERSPTTVVIVVTGYASLDSATEALRLGAYDYVGKPCHPDELTHRVAKALERGRLERELIEREKDAAMLEVIAGVADTFNNKLAGITSSAQLLQRSMEKQDLQVAQEAIKMILQGVRESADAIARVTRGMQAVRGSETWQVDLLPILQAFSQAYGEDIISVDYEADLPPVRATSKIAHCFRDIIDNSIDAMPDEQRVEITARSDSRAEMVTVQFRDRGCGIPPEDMSKVLIPFFTTKGTRKLGLGLWEVYHTVRGYGGDLDIESQVGAGTTVTVTLPMYKGT